MERSLKGLFRKRLFKLLERNDKERASKENLDALFIYITNLTAAQLFFSR